VESLAEALGYSPDQPLLILSADLAGSTHAATAATLTAMRDGSATTATLMMPGPWARHAVDQLNHGGHPNDDVGLHLTLNAELDCFRWGPLTHAPSLLDGDGGFPRTIADLWDHADLEEVRRECRAQLERARIWGLDITHLATHMSAMQQRPEFFDVLLDIACEADLPVRLEGTGAETAAGFPFRRLAAEEGIFMPDHFQLVRGGARAALDAYVAAPIAGVTEIAFEPALAAEEVRAIDPTATGRIDDLALLTDRTLPDRLARAGVTTIGYAAIRELQQSRS
jgi:predicted glycoside hydrolase/deacetylase ChbG (UPF0249 family)